MCLLEELPFRVKLCIEGLGWLKQVATSWSITKVIQQYSDEEEFETKMLKSFALTNPVVVLCVTISDRKNYKCQSLQFIRKTAKSYCNLFQVFK